MAWTAYHDALLNEMAVLMSDLDWTDDPTITRRLYGQSGDSSNPTPDSIIGQLQSTGADAGRIPVFETDESGKPTGKIKRNPDGTPVWQSADEGIASLLEQFETARVQGNAANEQRYNQLQQGYQDRTANILGGLTRDAEGNITGGFPTYSNLVQAYGGAMDRIAGADGTTGYGKREADVLEEYNAYWQDPEKFGGQARQDIKNQYAQSAANIEQSLQQRGLGNSTIRSSAMLGNTSRQAQDLGRFDQDLAMQRANLVGDLRGASLGAQQQSAQGQAALGQQQLQAAANLTQEPLGVIERRTDTVPSLADVANLATGFGRSQATSGFSLGAFNPTSYFQQKPVGSQ